MKSSNHQDGRAATKLTERVDGCFLVLIGLLVCVWRVWKAAEEILFCSKMAMLVTCCRRGTLCNAACISLSIPHSDRHEAFGWGEMKVGGASYLSCQALCLLQELGLGGSGFLHLTVPAVRSLHREGARKDHECQPMSN